MTNKRRFILESSDDEDFSQEGHYCYQEREKRTKTLQEQYPEEQEEFAEEEEEEIEEDPEEILEEEETEEEEEEESKKSHMKQPELKQDKKEKGNEQEQKRETKKRLWRLWNVDDEIKVLEGMLEFHKLNGNYGCGYTSGFYEFIKDLIQINVSRKQLQDKIKRLKKKYLNNKEKVEAGQDLFAFFNDHEKKLFLLSEKIWGDQEIEQDDENGSFRREEEDFWCMFPRLDESLKLEQFSDFTLPGSGISFVKQRLSCIGDSKAKELEEKWRELQVAETRVKLMRARLIQEQTELILDVIS